MRILIVDDDQFVRDSLQALLKYCEFEVRTCESGPEAISVAEFFRPNHVLIDWNLGHPMNGMDVSHAMLKLAPEVQVVMISGDLRVESDVTDQSFEFLMKPFQLPDLLSILGKTPTNS